MHAPFECQKLGLTPSSTVATPLLSVGNIKALGSESPSIFRPVSIYWNLDKVIQDAPLCSTILTSTVALRALVDWYLTKRPVKNGVGAAIVV